MIPEAEIDSGPYTAVVDADGYVTATIASIGVSTVSPDIAAVDTQLNPVTRIHVGSEAVDADSDGNFDQVVVTLSATAGSIANGFDGTAGEIKISDANGNATAGLTYADHVYTYTYDGYEAFSLTIDADASDTAHNVDAGYQASTTWYYVPSITDAKEVAITDAGTLTSVSGDTRVVLPPGGVSGDAGRRLVLTIVEVDPTAAGFDGESGSGFSAIELSDINGTPVPDGEVNEVMITMAFDKTITETQLLSNFAVYYADTIGDLAAGNYGNPIPIDDSMTVSYDDNFGWLTFSVDHLTAFGILSTAGDEPTKPTAGGSDGDDSCFIRAAGQPGKAFPWLFAGFMLVAGSLTVGAASTGKRL